MGRKKGRRREITREGRKIKAGSKEGKERREREEEKRSDKSADVTMSATAHTDCI